MFSIYLKKKYDYFSNTTPPTKSTFPNGMDIEIFNFKSLKKCFKKVKNNSFKEHVTHYFWKNKQYFKSKTYLSKKDLSNIRITVDYPSDIKIIKKIINNFKNTNTFNLNDIVKFMEFANRNEK